MSTKYNRGSEWRKWDLHFHTPSSYDYKDKSVSNEDIINVLSANNISVVAITDHHIIDIDRITKLKELGKERDITILPGIEFCSELGGSESIHYIAIFPENVKLDTIWTKIQAHCNLTYAERESKGEERICCPFVNTCNLIVELGGIITIHAGHKSNSIEGIRNNLLVKQELKQDLLSTFHPLLEIGKLQDKEDYEQKVFPEIKFSLPIIICSDNHNINDYVLKHPMWIKADSTFEGLKQVLNEPSERIYIGERPDIFELVENNRTKYIDKITIKPVDGYSGIYGKWFDNVELELNKELIAIIGNKGNGKSAIADIIANCCNYRFQEYFSFLHAKKFRDAKHANSFTATVVFADGTTQTKGLEEGVSEENLQTVKYLPQGYFETICNDLQKEENLREEIENVVFQYIDTSSRLGASSFKELVQKKSEAVNGALTDLKEQLSILNNEIITLEDKENPAYSLEISAKIKQKEIEIAALVKPEEVVKPDINDERAKAIMTQIEDINKKNTELNDQIDQLQTEQQQLAIDIEKIKSFVESVNNKIKGIIEFKEHNKALLHSFGVDIDTIFSVSISLDSVNSVLNEKQKRHDIITTLIQDDSQEGTNLKYQKKLNETKIKELKASLDEPSQRYQEYIKKLSGYEEAKKKIEGNATTPDTLLWYKSELEYINNGLLIDIQEKYKNRSNKVKEIYQKKKEIIAIYLLVKQKIDEKINENKELLVSYDLRIDASFGLIANIKENLLHYINQNVKGAFRGKQDGEALLSTIISNKDLQKEDDVISICEEIIEKLKNNKGEKLFIGKQVSDRLNFYNRLFSLDYLTYNYHILQGDKDLSILSPGEKGALLLVFYLLLDMDNSPLILDQPEDNLDNDSVANILVDFIKHAKKKRQIMIVTHNPNLAVVADAEQVIFVNINKKDGCNFVVESGSIENPIINKHIVDVLEGAMPAFRKRDKKYIDKKS